NVWQLELIRIVQGALTGSQAAAAALVAGAAPVNQVGFALGLISMAVQLGNTFGPVLGGFSVGALGFRGSFLLGGGMLLIGTLMAISGSTSRLRGLHIPCGPASKVARARCLPGRGSGRCCCCSWAPSLCFRPR